MMRYLLLLVCCLSTWTEVKSENCDLAAHVFGPTKTIVIEAFDASTRGTLPRFVLDFTSCGHKVYYSDDEGRFRMKAPEGFVCYIQISQPGYSKVNLKVDYLDIGSEEKTYTVYLSRSSNSHNLQVRDELRHNLYLEGTEVAVVSLLDSSEQRNISDKEGKLAFLLLKDHHYKVTARKEGYKLYQDTMRSLTDGSFSLQSLFLAPIEGVADKEKVPAWRGQPIDARKDKDSDHSGLRHYSIQVGATSDMNSDLISYQDDLASFGQVHLMAKDDFYRIRVGRYYNRKDAELDLARIREIAGYETAFLSYSIPVASGADAVVTKPTRAEAAKESEEHVPMVRLASYLNPEFFKSEMVAELGEVHMMKKDEWTVAVLRGFSTKEDAQAACEQAKTAGFRSAHLVEFINGVFQKIPK